MGPFKIADIVMLVLIAFLVAFCQPEAKAEPHITMGPATELDVQPVEDAAVPPPPAADDDDIWIHTRAPSESMELMDRYIRGMYEI